MTPTPEEIALAKDVAKELLSDGRMGYYCISYAAALTAIMKVREKAASFVDNYPIGKSCDDPVLHKIDLMSTAIRNGEHLR